jgi:hypothetical protein
LILRHIERRHGTGNNTETFMQNHWPDDSSDTRPETERPGPDLLEQTYQDVLVFERKLRLSLGKDLATFVSPEQREAFLSKLMDLIGEDSPASKRAYVQLINDVFGEIAPAFPVNDLYVLWPNGIATKDEAAFLATSGCGWLASIADEASRRLPSSAPRFLANKFKF